MPMSPNGITEGEWLCTTNIKLWGAEGLKPPGARLGVIWQSSGLGVGYTEAVGFDLAEEMMVQTSQLAQGNQYTRTSPSDLLQTFHGGSTKAWALVPVNFLPRRAIPPRALLERTDVNSARKSCRPCCANPPNYRATISTPICCPNWQNNRRYGNCCNDR